MKVNLSEEKINELFFQLENDFNTFDLYCHDTQIWDYLRRSVYREILQKQVRHGKAHPTSQHTLQNYVIASYLLAKNFFSKNPFLSDSSEYLFFGHPRRKLQDDGYWWDIYFDPIHETGELDYLQVEKDYHLNHFEPTRTKNLKYLDLINYSAKFRSMAQKKLYRLPTDTCNRLEKIEMEISDIFSVNIDLVSMAKSRLLFKNSVEGFVKKLLKIIDPKLVVCTVGYGLITKEAIEICKELGIKTVEFQHGVIHPRHLGYHFPNSENVSAFPDYLLTWGDFWLEQAKFPILDSNVIPVGYPYLEQALHQVKNTRSRKQILFISQGTIGEELSKFAMEVDQHPDIDHKVVYKLHPSEFGRWRDEYPWLVTADFDILDTTDPPLYELFAQSSAQVGVYSTAVFEGLCFDIETYVYDLPGSSVLNPLVDKGAAERVSSVDELASSVGSGAVTFNRKYYFEENATENVCQTLQQLASDG